MRNKLRSDFNNPGKQHIQWGRVNSLDVKRRGRVLNIEQQHLLTGVQETEESLESQQWVHWSTISGDGEDWAQSRCRAEVSSGGPRILIDVQCLSCRLDFQGVAISRQSEINICELLTYRWYLMPLGFIRDGHRYKEGWGLTPAILQLKDEWIFIYRNDDTMVKHWNSAQFIGNKIPVLSGHWMAFKVENFSRHHKYPKKV